MKYHFYINCFIQAVITNIAIVAGNGIFWPYGIIWASSQARKESLSFLRMLINAIILCKCEVFKEKSALQGVKAVSEWKECERKSKSVRITGNNFDSNHKKQQTFHNNRHNFGEVSRQTSFDRVLPIRMIEQPRESNERKQFKNQFMLWVNINNFTLYF